MARLFICLLCAGLVSACAPAPQIASAPTAARAADAPALMPLDPLLARATAGPADPTATLTARAAGLRARAARLRGPLAGPRAPRRAALP